MELYLILKLVWWVLLGVLFMGLAIMMGMDMGVGALLRFVGKTDTERRVCLNAIGPHWDGNQVWGSSWAAAPFSPPSRSSTPRPSRACMSSCSCCCGA